MKKIIHYLIVFTLFFYSANTHADELADALDAYNRGDYNVAIQTWTKLAPEGNAKAQNNLGSVYVYGTGATKNYATAIKWYTKAAEQGLVQAQTNLGLLYNNGQGVKKDYATAAKWYTKAAEQGYANAQRNLGFLYDYGQGVKKDYATAAKWYTKAAEQGNANAQYNLGVFHLNGIETKRTKRNEYLATKYLKLSAKQGHESAGKVLARLNQSKKHEKTKRTDAETWDTIFRLGGKLLSMIPEQPANSVSSHEIEMQRINRSINEDMVLGWANAGH